uniref:mannose-6-phosphate isomerase n=1 Tax=Corethrella appendiculata TaxID=1370023 RepID=U5ESC5_9DIPT
MEIIGDVKTYDWGKTGKQSEVAKLAELNNENFIISESTNYSELWMGDHVSGPSKVKGTNENLGDFLTKDLQSNIGGHEKLSFLFKVLSIGKALSVQVHPNKKEAVKLNAEFPDIYKDPNHKPELAIALTDFVAMCGFRPYDEIYSLLSKYEEFAELLGADNLYALKAGKENGLKLCYSKLMRSSDADLTKCIQSIKQKILSSGDVDNELSKIFLQLDKDFPNDVGILSIFFLNILRLTPGEAIYLPANVPHAYLSGDCVECMACSDNVIRAGLTPKFKDVETLLRLLNYTGESADKKIFQSIPSKQSNEIYTQVFVPDVTDFAVAKISVPSSIGSYSITNNSHGSIVLVLAGAANASGENIKKLHLKRGTIIFIPANCPSVKLEIETEGFVAYQAMYNNF